jgi:hypothetical protein
MDFILLPDSDFIADDPMLDPLNGDDDGLAEAIHY